MKNQKPKMAASVKRSETFKRTGLVLNSDHRSMGFEYWPRPSELELAQLAARLARTKAIDPGQLVKEAWGIYWESCRKIKEDYLQVERHLKSMEAFEADNDSVMEEEDGLPHPKTYPVRFQEMELLLLPKLKGRTAERAALFREYLFAEMINERLSSWDEDNSSSYWDYLPEQLEDCREAAKQEVSEEFGKCRSRVYDVQAYSRFAISFLRWYRGWIDLRNSEARSANASRGWEKRRKARTAKTGPRLKTEAFKEVLTGNMKTLPTGA
jgi:hypothetical protein